MGRQEFNNIARKLADIREETELQDGGKTIIKCSACGKPLVEIWVIRPDAPITSNIVVMCAHCGDKSFILKVDGQYCVGHIESGETEIKDIDTEIEDSDSMTQTVVIYTEKR